MESFKIKVTPEQSKIIQDEMFKRGWRWNFKKDTVDHTERQYLFFHEDYRICYSTSYSTFLDDDLPELTFEQFESKYLTKQP